MQHYLQPKPQSSVEGVIYCGGMRQSLEAAVDKFRIVWGGVIALLCDDKQICVKNERSAFYKKILCFFHTNQQQNAESYMYSKNQQFCMHHCGIIVKNIPLFIIHLHRRTQNMTFNDYPP